MIRIIKNHIQCDGCNAHLSYDNEDTYESFNVFRTHRVLYLDCPKCNYHIPIRVL